MSTQPGVYTKDEVTKVAAKASDAVALAFQGYKRVGDLPDTASKAKAEKQAEVPSDLTPPEKVAPKPTAPKKTDDKD